MACIDLTFELRKDLQSWQKEKENKATHRQISIDGEKRYRVGELKITRKTAVINIVKLRNFNQTCRFVCQQTYFLFLKITVWSGFVWPTKRQVF